jgi:hypothetical protein
MFEVASVELKQPKPFPKAEELKGAEVTENKSSMVRQDGFQIVADP